MSLAPSRTAFVADQLDELTLCALHHGDLSIVLEPSGAGLRLTVCSDEDNFAMTYDGSQWTDVDPQADDSQSEDEFIWPPLIPREVRDADPTDDDAVYEQLVATIEAHGPLVELFTTLVATGWRVTLHHHHELSDHSPSNPSIRIHATAGEIIGHTGDIASRVLHVPGALSEIEAVYRAQDATNSSAAWGFVLGNATVSTASGEHHQVEIESLILYAICTAPEWALRPDIDRPVERHTDGELMKQSILMNPPSPPAATERVILERRATIDEWARSKGFGPRIEGARPTDVQRELDSLGTGNAGYYLIEFTNGDCYLGQSTTIAERLKGHRTRRKDITSIRLRPDPTAEFLANPLRHLLDHEADLIHDLQVAGLPARNKAQMTYLTDETRGVDEILARHGTTATEWLADPIGVNQRMWNAGRVLTVGPDQLAGAAEAYELWLKRTGDNAETVRSLFSTYMHRCLPLPLQTEYVYWVLSSPRVIPSFRSLSNLSIGFTEAFRIMIGKDGRLSGMLHVNGVELLGPDMSDDALVRFLRQHPGVSVSESRYQAAGPFNLMIWAPDLETVGDLLDDTTVTRAAATAAIHLMRKSKVGKNKESHNPILVNAVLGTD